MTADAIWAVLERHRLTAGWDESLGEIVCVGCRRVLGNPMKHLADALASALDPAYSPPASTESAGTASRREDPRESQIKWKGTA